MYIVKQSLVHLYGENGSLQSCYANGKYDADLVNDALATDEGNSCALGTAIPYTVSDIEQVRDGKLKLNSSVELTDDHRRALGVTIVIMKNHNIDYVI